jgi:uncharacterized membrane protein
MRTLWTAALVLACVAAVPLAAVLRAWHQGEPIPVIMVLVLNVFLGILTAVLVEAARLDAGCGG